MATVDKNFRIKNGLVVEGSTATVNGSNVLTENSLEFLQDTAADQLVNGSHTNISVSYNDTTGAISLTGAVTYTDEQAQDAVGNAVGTGLSYNDSTGAISVDTTAIQAKVANVTDTEIGYLDGVTSSIQTQLDAKATSSDLTAHTGATEAHGATGAVVGTTNTQTLTNKTLTTPILTGPVVTTLTVADSSISFEGSSNDTNETLLTVTNPTADRTITLPDASGTVQLRVADVDDTEIGYLNGVTSGIQAQLDAKAPSSTAVTLTGTETLSNKTLSSPTITDASFTNAFSTGIWTRVSDYELTLGLAPGYLNLITPNSVVKLTNGGTVIPQGVGSLTESGGTWTLTLNGTTPVTAGSWAVEVIKTVDSSELTTLDGVTSPIQAQLDAKLALAGGTMTGAIAMGTNKITGLGTPTDATDASTKGYVDSAISTEVSNRNTAISNAVDSLVDGAPALLNTLNELAAAINDDANYTTTITTALGTKAPLASPDLTGTPTAPTAAANTNTTQIATTAFAKAEADAAESAAITAAASDATTKANAAQSAAEATASSALSGVTAGTTAFTAVNVNSVAKQIAATTGNIVTAAATTAYSWAKASYRSGEFLVKAKNGNHTEVAKIMVTLDTSDNVYVTEYGMSSTSGVSLQTVSADISGTDVRIRVTPANNNTEVLITGTLLV